MYQGYKSNRKPIGPMGMQPIQPVQAPAAMAPQPTAMDQIGQMAMGKVAGNAVDAGIGKVGTMYEGSKLQSGVNSMLGPLMGGAAESTAAMTSGAEGASAMRYGGSNALDRCWSTRW